MQKSLQQGTFKRKLWEENYESASYNNMTNLCSYSSHRRRRQQQHSVGVAPISLLLCCLPISAHAFSTVTQQPTIQTQLRIAGRPTSARNDHATGHRVNNALTTNSFLRSHQQLPHRRQLPPRHCSYSQPRRQSQLKAAPIDIPVARSVWWQPVQGLAAAAVVKFASQWRTYCLIPIIAGLVGWVTNYLAVKMIFHPIAWRGIPLWKKRQSIHSERLLPGDATWYGLGWQGIVPAKTKKMSEAMVNATVTQLLRMEEVVGRLDPFVVADILLPQTPNIVGPMVDDILDSYFSGTTNNNKTGTDNNTLRNWIAGVAKTKSPWQDNFSRQFLVGVTKDFQLHVNRLLNVRNCVVKQMLADRSLLGKLFQIAGRKELTFLTDSGLWFGFLLGLLQLAIALLWDNPWTLSFGGLIVGLATNWLALKWIFEPVNPTPIVGNIVLQGLFLRRQKEVSADFSNFFATKILTSEQLWHSILNDPSTAPAFATIWAQNLEKVALEETKGIVDFSSERFKGLDLQGISRRATDRLYPYLSELHPYVDEELDIETTLRTRMEAMTSEQFERVLHPIFEEDELTLILSGGLLGFLAGLIQQGLACGTIKFLPTWRWLATTSALGGIGFCAYAVYFASSPIRLGTFRRRISKRLRGPSKIAFAAIDTNNNGYFEPGEISTIAKVLGINLSEDQLKEAFTDLDKNSDGRVSLEEFEDWWNQDLGSEFHKELARELGLYRPRRPKWTRLALQKMRNPPSFDFAAAFEKFSF